MNKTLKIFLGLLVITIVVWLVNSLMSGTEQANKIKIGIISPLTGLIANGDNLGQGFANGVIMAQEEYNAAHPDKAVSIVLEDDGYDSKKGISAYQKEVSVDQVDSIINLSSPTIDAIKTEVQKSGKPLLQLGAEAQVSKDNVFQMFPDQTSIKMVAEEANRDGIKTITAVIEQVQAYEKFITDFQATFNGTLIIERVPSGEKDLKSTALKLKTENSDGVLIFMSAQPGSQLVKRMKEISYKPKNIYFDLGLQLGSKDYEAALGGFDYLNGAKALYAVSKVDPNFDSRYKARFNANPDMMSGYGFDCFNVIIATYANTSDKWIENIQKYKDEGVTGKISFDDVGLRPADFKIAVVEDGKVVVK